MSLVRLLTAGKSLVGIRDAESRYRVTNQRLLPKFGKRNPFRGAASAPKREAARAAAPGVASPATPASGANEGLGAAETACASSAAPGWFARLAGLFRRKPSAGRSAIPRFDKAGVQGELSLEAVKVVRNDLSDSDLVVVPARAGAGNVTASGPVVPREAPQATEAAGTATNRI